MVLNAAICDRARLARDARFDGRFFIAVLSTGIYCRPICPSPHARRENVRYFASAEEAVAAGFRACRRCRPEAAPGTPRWNGTASTVSRALKLIEEGALQEESVEVLARRLGVSARQLHRLFSIHLGASPIAVAKSWRLSYARRLLRETELPMSRVALEAGFRTVRRFNDAIREEFGMTPSAVRGSRELLDVQGDGYVLHLPCRAPYDWDSLLTFLAERAIPGVEEVLDGVYRRTFAHEGRQGVVEVRHDARRRGLEARVRVVEPHALLPVLNRLRSLFDPDTDTAATDWALRKNPALGPTVRRHPGLRTPGAWDPFEMSVRAAFGETFDSPAEPGLGRFAARFGLRLSPADSRGLTHLFPSAEVVATARLDASPGELARTIRSLAQASVTGADGDSLSRVHGLTETASQYVAFRTAPVSDVAAAAIYRWRAGKSSAISSKAAEASCRATSSPS